MLQQDKPEDFVIATGVQFSVRTFVDKTAKELDMGDVIVKIDPRYFRPAEVETLLGDPTKAKEKLGWMPKITLDEMVEEMVACDLIRQSNMRCLSGRGLRFLWGGSEIAFLPMNRSVTLHGKPRRYTV